MLYKQIQKIIKITLSIIFVAFLFFNSLTFVVSADTPTDPSPSGSLYDSYAEPSSSANDCRDSSLDRSNCGIVRYLVFFINILSAVVGIVVTGTIIMGGIQYSTSGGDPSKIQAAKKRVFNGIFALIAFIFSYAFLQYIVPGGVL